MRIMTTALALLLGTVSVGCSTAVSHQIDGSTGDEAGSGDDARDAPDAGPDEGICRPGAPGICTNDADCVAWNDAVGPAGTTVSSMCAGGRCTLGVLNCSSHDGLTWCQCVPRAGTLGDACLGDQVCVSDAPGGPTRCEQQCVGR